MHQLIITQHPHLKETYSFFDDHDEFKPNKLDFGMENDAKKTESTYGKLTGVIK